MRRLYVVVVSTSLMLVVPMQLASADSQGTSSFWQSKLAESLYNGNPDDQGDANGDGIPDGDKDFYAEMWCEDDLLLTFGFVTDTEEQHDDGVEEVLPDRFLVWDADGLDPESDEITLTFEELSTWVKGGERRGQRDFIEILQRDVAATYLNTLNNTCLSGSHDDPVFDLEIIDSYEDAISFILSVDGGKKQQKSAWEDFGWDAHAELAAYNEGG